MKRTDSPQQPHFWRLAGACVAAAMRLVPRKRRFGAAVLLSRAAVRVLRLAPQFRLLANTKFDSGIEIALHLLLHTLTTNGTSFDPPIAIDGYAPFLDAYRTGRGMLLVSPHAALGLLMLRRFHEEGIAPFVLAPAPMPIPGTDVIAETVARSATSLVRTRTRLREGRLVCAMLDLAAHEPGERTTEFDTVLGPVIFAPALLHLAARCGANVAFCESRLDRRSVRGRIVVASSTTPDGVEQEFIDFVRSAAVRRAASAPLARLERAET